MKNWLIKKLGGFTAEEYAGARDEVERLLVAEVKLRERLVRRLDLIQDLHADRDFYVERAGTRLADEALAALWSRRPASLVA